MAHSIYVVFRKTPHTIKDVMGMYITQLMVILDMINEEVKAENKAIEDARKKGKK